jgi:hypothetical protein
MRFGRVSQLSPPSKPGSTMMICQMGDIAVDGKEVELGPREGSLQGRRYRNRKLSRAMRSPWRLEMPGPTGADQGKTRMRLMRAPCSS